MADLDNYAYPLATRLRTEDLVSVWCTKRHAATSRVLVAAADETAAPSEIYTVRTTASTQTRAYKEQIRSAVSSASEIAPGPVQLQLGYVVGPQRNWTSLSKPTLAALHPPLAHPRPPSGVAPDPGIQGAVPPRRVRRIRVRARPRPATARVRRRAAAQRDQPVEAHDRRPRPAPWPYPGGPGLAPQGRPDHGPRAPRPRRPDARSRCRGQYRRGACRRRGHRPMTLTFAQIMASGGIDPTGALVIRHAYVREHEDGSVGIHGDSSDAEIMAYTRVQSANTRTFPDRKSTRLNSSH